MIESRPVSCAASGHSICAPSQVNTRRFRRRKARNCKAPSVVQHSEPARQAVAKGRAGQPSFIQLRIRSRSSVVRLASRRESRRGSPLKVLSREMGERPPSSQRPPRFSAGPYDGSQLPVSPKRWSSAIAPLKLTKAKRSGVRFADSREMPRDGRRFSTPPALREQRP